MNVWATTDRQESTMCDLSMSNTKSGFFIMFTQKRRGKLQRWQQRLRCFQNCYGHWPATRHILGLIHIQTRKPPLEVAPTSLAIFLADCEFSAGCYLFTVSNSGLHFSHSPPSQQLPSSFSSTDTDSAIMNQHVKYLFNSVTSFIHFLPLNCAHVPLRNYSLSQAQKCLCHATVTHTRDRLL